MLISFFEEYPGNKILSNLNLIDFSTKIYLGDYSIEGFKQYKRELKNYKNIKEFIWWPIINVNEGYWLSPWSKRKALLRTFHNLLNENIPILWDAELPRNRLLLFTQSFKFFKNKFLINSFMKRYKGKIYTAEYAFSNKISNKIFEFFGLFFSPEKYNTIQIKMMYTSMHPISENYMESKIKEGLEKYKDRFLVGLGVIATGIRGNEKLISLKNLERDLNICKKLGVSEVVIYRLGGLSKDYLRIIKKFV